MYILCIHLLINIMYYFRNKPTYYITKKFKLKQVRV